MYRCGQTAADPGTATPPAAGDNAPAQQAETPAADADPDMVNLHLVFSGAEPNDHDYVIAAVNAALAEQGYNFSVRQTFVTEYWTNIALMIASAETVDIAWAHMSTISDLVSRGVYQPIEPYFDTYAPDIAAHLPDHVRAQGSVGGVLYAVPRVIPMAQFNWVMTGRRDLREAWGLPEIVDMDTLEAYLARALEEGMIPTHAQNFRSKYAYYANFFFPMGDQGLYPIFVDPNDPTFTVRSFFDTEYFRNVVERRLHWREMGWIPEDEAAFGADANQGFFHSILAITSGNLFAEAERIDNLRAQNPDGVIELVTLNPHTRYVFQGGDNMMGVGSTSNNPREAVQFMNWIRKSQENFDLWTFGVYGRNYVLDQGAVSIEGIPGDMAYVPRRWVWNDVRLNRFSANMPQEHVNNLLNWDNGAIVTPFVGFVINPDNINTEFGQVTAIMAEFIPIFEQGIVPYDALIDDLMSQLWNAGLQNIIDETQIQLNEFLGL